MHGRVRVIAKTIAAISGNILTNVVWCPDSQRETDIHKNPRDRPIGIGCTYLDGKWYTDGTEILTLPEDALKTAQEMRAKTEF